MIKPVTTTNRLQAAYDDILYHLEFGDEIKRSTLDAVKDIVHRLTPVKPTVWSCNETRYSPSEFEVYCPSCEMTLNITDEYTEFEYCPYCGQAIDWGKKNE